MDTENVPPCGSPSPFIKRTVDLYDAIEKHDVQKVERIIRQYGGCIDSNRIVIGMEMSLLHLAVGLSENSPEIVRAFLRIGGNPNNINCSETLSPMHLSVMNDYDEVLSVLLIHGGNPAVLTGDKKSCFDIALENRVNTMEEKCFDLLFKRYCSFRKSLKHKTMDETLTKGISDISQYTFYTCDSDEIDSDCSVFSNSTPKNPTSFRKMNANYSYLMTEDESNDNGGTTEWSVNSSSESENDKLTTIPEDTEPISLNKSDSLTSYAASSCANFTPPLLMSPTREQLVRLQASMKKVNIPVTPSTYPILSRFEGNAVAVAELLENSSTPFSNELHLALDDLNRVNDWGQHKIDLLQGAITSPSKRTSKSFYNYVLLDPKIIKRTNFSGNHLKSDVIKNAEKFEIFLSAIFYIGKGCGKRPIQHLVEAKAKLTESKHKKTPAGQKIDKILEIWKAGLGVLLVSVFHHSSEREANVNEAAMIDAVGLVELSNLKKGSYLGTVAARWSQKTKNQFGTFLLYKSYCSFAVSDPKFFYPADI